MLEIRILRHKLFNGSEFYSLGRVDSGGYTYDKAIWESTPEILQKLVNEAFQKEPVDAKIRRFSGGS